MTYRELWSKLGYSLFTVGVCLELLALMAARDLALWIAGGSDRLIASGRRQLEALDAS